VHLRSRLLKNRDSFVYGHLFFFFFSPRHLEIYPNNLMQSAHTIKTWVKNFEETGSALTKKRSGRIRIVGTPDNVAAV
jgi:hypothetical protein